jgi:HSP20 family molecular chaperone IbpA
MPDEVRKRFWDTFEQMQEEFDLFFNHYAHAMRPAQVGFRTRWAPPCNIYDAGDSLCVLVEIGGVTRAGIDLRVETDRLVLTGQRLAPDPGAAGTYERMEIAFGEFELELPLSAPVDGDAAEAWYHDGFLHVVLPKIAACRQCRVTLVVLDRD